MVRVEKILYIQDRKGRIRELPEKDEIVKSLIEYRILSAAQLIKIQEELIGLGLPQSNLIEPDQLHLSLLQYPSPSVLYGLVREVSQPRSHVEFVVGLAEVAEQAKIIGPEFLEVEAVELAWYGDGQTSYIVLVLKKDPVLLAPREQVFNNFLDFLKAWGVADVKNFLRQNGKLRHQVDYKPHITLARFDCGLDLSFARPSLPGIDVSTVNVTLVSPSAYPKYQLLARQSNFQNKP